MSPRTQRTRGRPQPPPELRASPAAPPAQPEVGEEAGTDNGSRHEPDGDNEDAGLPLGRERQRPVGAELARGSQQLLVLGEPAQGVDEEAAVAEAVEEVVGEPGVRRGDDDPRPYDARAPT